MLVAREVTAFSRALLARSIRVLAVSSSPEFLDARLARTTLPARLQLGRGGRQLCPFLRARDQGRAVPLRRPRGHPGDGTAHAAGEYRPRLARLPAGRAPRPAIRLPRPRTL